MIYDQYLHIKINRLIESTGVDEESVYDAAELKKRDRWKGDVKASFGSAITIKQLYALCKLFNCTESDIVSGGIDHATAVERAHSYIRKRKVMKPDAILQGRHTEYVGIIDCTT